MSEMQMSKKNSAHKERGGFWGTLWGKFRKNSDEMTKSEKNFLPGGYAPKDIDALRHPEEQNLDPSEYPKAPN